MLFEQEVLSEAVTTSIYDTLRRIDEERPIDPAEDHAPGALLDGTVGPARHWSPDTREIRRKGYGRWLTFLITSGCRAARLRCGDVPRTRRT